MVVKVLGYNWFSVVVWMWKIVPVVFSFLCEGFRNICRWRMVVMSSGDREYQHFQAAPFVPSPALTHRAQEA